MKNPRESTPLKPYRCSSNGLSGAGTTVLGTSHNHAAQETPTGHRTGKPEAKPVHPFAPPPTEQGNNMGKLSSIVKPVFDGCKFGEIIENHADAEDRATIADRNVTSAAVWEFVCEQWEPVGRTTVKEHRNRLCTCYRAAA